MTGNWIFGASALVKNQGLGQSASFTIVKRVGCGCGVKFKITFS
jgi:hypothetical protein